MICRSCGKRLSIDQRRREHQAKGLRVFSNWNIARIQRNRDFDFCSPEAYLVARTLLRVSLRTRRTY